MAKKFRVEITATAEQDLRSIRDFIARDKPAAAERWLTSISRKILGLKSMPLRHEIIPEAPEIGVDYRHMLQGVYRIIYRVEGRRVFVIRVIHGARLLDHSILGATDNP